MAEPALAKFWDKVVTDDTVALKRDDTSNDDTLCHLLWGDRVRVLEENRPDGKVKVSARGFVGLVDPVVLGDDPVLEVYVIDVGQGDGLLVVTPEGHQIMIDGGNLRRFQPTKRNASDFVDWKFTRTIGPIAGALRLKSSSMCSCVPTLTRTTSVGSQTSWASTLSA